MTTTPASRAGLAPARARVLATTVVLFSVMVAHALLETARDALFLAHLGPGHLAWAYLAIAGSALLAFLAVRRLAGLRDPRRLLIAFIVIAAVGTAALAATITLSHSLVFALYVWTGLVATLVVPCYWTLVDRSLDVDEAKRSFAIIGAGGVSGALVGSAVAALLGQVVEAQHLVTAGAGVFGLAIVAAVVLAPHPLAEAPLPRARQARGRPSRRAHRYVRLLVGLAMVSTVALTLGDLAFKRVVAERIPAESLATAFGTIYAGLNVVALLVQLLIAPRLIARLGIGPALTILPLVMLFTAAGFAITAITATVIALKLGDGSLRHSLHRVTSELLFLPVPAKIRDGLKPVADAVGQRGGQVAAALVVLAVGTVSMVEPSARMLATMAAAASLVWLGLARLTRAAYVAQFSAMLAAGEIHRTRRLPRLDAQALQLLTQALASPDESEAVAALELLGRQPGQVPALVLYHPRTAVVRRALELLEGDPRPDVAVVLDHLVEHADPEVRATALAVSSRLGRHHVHLRSALNDAHPEVRATAAVAMLEDAACAPAASAGVDAMVAGTTADRVALARAISHHPTEAMRTTLSALLARREPAVLAQVLEVYVRAPELADLSRLLALLADFHVRGDVRQVFLAAGDRGFEVLVGALDDPQTLPSVRRHVPRTLSRFRSAAAAAALAARLPHEADSTTEFKILRALGAMRVGAPDLPIDHAPLRQYLRRAVAQAARFASLLDQLAADPEPEAAGTGLLHQLLSERRGNAVERAFRTLGILHPRTDLRSVHDALTGNDPTRRSAAREIFEAVVDLETRTVLFAALDDLAPEVRRLRLGPLAAGPFADYHAFIADLLSDPSDSIRCVAAYHVAECGMLPLCDTLLRARHRDASPLVLHTLDQAIATLCAKPAWRLHQT